MSKKSLATFVGNCNQPPKENNLYKQFKPLLELNLVVLYTYLFFQEVYRKSFDTNTETRLRFPELWSWSYTTNITTLSSLRDLIWFFIAPLQQCKSWCSQAES